MLIGGVRDMWAVGMGIDVTLYRFGWIERLRGRKYVRGAGVDPGNLS